MSIKRGSTSTVLAISVQDIDYGCILWLKSLKKLEFTDWFECMYWSTGYRLNWSFGIQTMLRLWILIRDNKPDRHPLHTLVSACVYIGLYSYRPAVSLTDFHYYYNYIIRNIHTGMGMPCTQIEDRRLNWSIDAPHTEIHGCTPLIKFNCIHSQLKAPTQVCNMIVLVHHLKNYINNWRT